MNIFYDIHTTCKNLEEARKIGHALVLQKLAICVNIIEKVNSIYWWEGKIVDESESLLLLKTKKEKVDQVIKLITKMHSYKLPGISVYKIDKVTKEIEKWINESLK
ncbi:MAG: divalent-cation tolerance protein CutA [Patescibacteria group bacterium]|jgi:periplasmic divalent cation tolerance protein